MALIEFALLAQEGQQQSSPLPTFILLGLMFGGLYFFMIRPQQKRQKEAASFASSIGPGDRVVTNAGIYGTVTAVEDGAVHLEVDRDVVLKVAKSAIARSQDQAESPKPKGRKADTESGSSDPSTDSDSK
jgi:preprotein translocase subunit YajC